MNPKCYAAFLIVLGSLFWLAMMAVSQTEALTTPHARFLFLMIFMIATMAGLLGLVFLFAEMHEALRMKGGKHEQ